MTRNYLHRHTKTAPTGHAQHHLGSRIRLAYSRSRDGAGLRRLASAVLLLTIGLGVATLAFANTLATEGGSQVSTQSEIDALTTANANLEVEVAKLTSVTRIYNEAIGLGLVAPKQAETVGGASPVALRP